MLVMIHSLPRHESSRSIQVFLIIYSLLEGERKEKSGICSKAAALSHINAGPPNAFIFCCRDFFPSPSIVSPSSALTRSLSCRASRGHKKDAGGIEDGEEKKTRARPRPPPHLFPSLPIYIPFSLLSTLHLPHLLISTPTHPSNPQAPENPLTAQ